MLIVTAQYNQCHCLESNQSFIVNSTTSEETANQPKVSSLSKAKIILSKIL
nr:MAG TPA: hypothetical protein [Caudoviricetes sp.]